MDPVSLMASVAGLILFAKEVRQLSSDLYHTVKRKPHVLRAIVEDLDTLQSVLEELSKDTSTPDQDILPRVLSSCNRTLTDINAHLTVLQQMFSKKLVSRLMSYKKFDEETKVIVGLHNELGTFKATLSLALHLRIL